MQSSFLAHRHHYSALDGDLCRLSALNRINALACIMAARHGWVGASFSVAELLTTLYFGLHQRGVILSKGHAAAMQYACLAGLGIIPVEALLSYKDGPGALQAHTDRCTQGILLDTGSLGQALSRAAGLAQAMPRDHLHVVIGDGELQEGQVFEALQAISHGWHVEGAFRNLTVILDLNGFQTAAEVDMVRRIPDRAGLFTALGFEVRTIQGHSPEELIRALTEPPRAGPRMVIARTRKAGGSAFLSPEGALQRWHSRIPEPELYAAILKEQVALTGLQGLQGELEGWLATAEARRSPGRLPTPAPRSTRDGFVDAMEDILDRRPDVVVLDADLAEACGLLGIADPGERFARRGQFMEMGISEQHMVSCAGGLALGGRMPVTCTYAAFMKRAVDQVHANVQEGSKVIYTGHYGGLGYFTDGPSHQSLEDLSIFRAVKGLVLAEPATAEQAASVVTWAVEGQDRSVYIRLHRTGRALDLEPDPGDPTAPMVRPGSGERVFVALGPIAAALARQCLDEPDMSDFGLVVPAVFGLPPDLERWRQLLGSASQVVTLEEDRYPGILRSFVLEVAAALGLDLEMRSIHPQRRAWSVRRIEDCLAHQGFTVAAIRAVLRDELRP